MKISLISAAVVVWGVLLPAATRGAEYSVDFRNSWFDNSRLRPIGTGAPTLLKPSREGLTVTLPAGTPADDVGFAPRFRLRGDFQVTLEYEIVELAKPSQGYGVGPSIYVLTASDDRHAATLGRVHRVEEGHVHTAHQGRSPGDDGRRRQSVRLFSTDHSRGYLRLERVGDQIRYSASVGGEFRTLHEASFTSADVMLLRISLKRNGAGSDAAAHVVLKGLEIRADRFAGEVGDSWPIWLAVAVLVGLVAIGVGSARWRWKRGSR